MAAGPVIGPVDARPALRGDIRLARRGPDASARSVAGGAGPAPAPVPSPPTPAGAALRPSPGFDGPEQIRVSRDRQAGFAQPPARRSDGVLATSFGDGAQRQDRRLPVPSGCLSRGIGFEIGGLCAVVAGSTGLCRELAGLARGGPMASARPALAAAARARKPGRLCRSGRP